MLRVMFIVNYWNNSYWRSCYVVLLCWAVEWMELRMYG